MHLLIDGKNILYRALFAAENDSEFTNKKSDKFAAISRFMHYYYDKVRPKHTHVFWDAPKKDLWRRSIHALYKDGRNPGARGIDIESELVKYQEIASEVWSAMGIRQYYRASMEADDLIFAFCHHIRSTPIVIVSSDSDLVQIMYYHNNVDILSPQTKKFVDKPTLDPVSIKCLQGDKTDNIKGYDGIGKVKSKRLVESPDKLFEFLQANGDNIYRRNRRIIDLSLCPFTLDNILYIMKILSTEKPQFDSDKLKELLHEKYKMRGMVVEYPKTILPFSWR
ncbi:MAG: hypothetical protein GF411_13855 [Candidatus Lokiarchaeota archaeon]|nr:hypothetical protein [Candidatus Lokiarchaeota archaeon]